MKIKMLFDVYDDETNIKICNKGEIFEVKPTKNTFYYLKNIGDISYGIKKSAYGKEFIEVD